MLVCCLNNDNSNIQLEIKHFTGMLSDILQTFFDVMKTYAL